jgi:hypothetical protein
MALIYKPPYEIEIEDDIICALAGNDLPNVLNASSRQPDSF